MQSIRGLELPIVPARVLSHAIGPLIDAPLHLFFIFSIIEHRVSDGSHYHCQRESNDWNGHRVKMLVMYYPNIILVTKQGRADDLLNYGVAVWVMTFSTIPSFLLMICCRQCVSSRRTKAVPNRIDETHIFQQRLSKFHIVNYAVTRLTLVEVI